MKRRTITIIVIILLLILLLFGVALYYIYSAGNRNNNAQITDTDGSTTLEYGRDRFESDSLDTNTRSSNTEADKKDATLNSNDQKQDATKNNSTNRQVASTNPTAPHANSSRKSSNPSSSNSGGHSAHPGGSSAAPAGGGTSNPPAGGGSSSGPSSGGGSGSAAPGDTTPSDPPIKNTHSVASDSQLGGACSSRNHKGGEYKQFTHSNGYTAPYLLHEHTNAAAHGLIIYLHGDGYGEHTNYCKNNTRTIDPYIEIARTHKMTMIAPRTPDTGTKTWWRASYSAEWLAGLISEIKAMHKVDSNKIWVVGYSGGAEVTSYSLMAKYSYLFSGGGAIMIGGGGWHSHSVASQPLSDSVKQNFTMLWLVGERDTAGQDNDGGFDALAASRRGFDHYRQAGIRNIEHKIISNTGHYNYGSAGPDNLSRLIK